MAVQTFKLPDPGEGLVEAEIVEWKVAPGDTVKVNDIVVEVETAKSLVELPIPWSGTVAQILVDVGATVDVGTPIITIDDGTGAGSGDPGGMEQTGVSPASGAAQESAKESAKESTQESAQESAQEATLVGYGAKAGASARRSRRAAAGGPSASRGMPPSGQSVAAAFQPGPAAVEAASPATPTAAEPVAAPARHAQPATGPAVEPAGGRPKAKPPVRKLVKDLGIDLAAVTPTGPDGIVTREDVQAFAARPSAPPAPAGAPVAGPAAYAPVGDREVRIPVKGVRKMTAQAMVASAFTAPHVTEWVTVDVTRTMELLDRLRADREFADVKVTPLLVLAKALLVAIRRHPGMNATWDEAAQEIVQKRYVNLGIAAATPRGLIVPNIKDADRLDLHGLAVAIGGLTATAREGRTQPADMAGGTMTITNVGVFGVDSGTPILNPGESAIVAFGAIRKQPWVVTAADGTDEIGIRHVTTLAVSFDHRLIDGELGSRFLADVAALLEDPSRALVWG
ncbi:MAG TPA: dihydrolipoamide acetyltransferase family protein [Intrasporangium sp.]|uniref:dihydrolipoamide acetyltransferase family protein n=1 Tax=Intrasporangium sp. TaxID=1925024 RepID=UPI002D76E66E|nr:dihydrolipoamide acetyltransferase family protein [Intrasporangium sp.]HET7397402.1 dihydrolipoamide acetyltransferase family protein [Intrasporangium sp.]